VAARRLEIEKIVEDQRRREREAEEERRRREREAEERRRREREAEEQRRREREAEERRRREREAEERRRREREAEERRRREREAEEEWRRRERRADPQQAQILSGHLSEEALVRASVEAGQRLAAALPLTPPPHLAAYSLERSAEESRWLSYEAGWQRTASLRAGADPPTFARELQLHMHVLRVPRQQHRLQQQQQQQQQLVFHHHPQQQQQA
jgi:colicin import membrane protein